MQNLVDKREGDYKFSNGKFLHKKVGFVNNTVVKIIVMSGVINYNIIDLL